MADTAGLWESLFSGATTAGGLYKLMDQMRSDRGDVRGTITDMNRRVDDLGSFKPYGVTSAVGNSEMTKNGLDMMLNQGQQQQMDQLGQGAMDMYGRAQQDPRQREQDIYERIRAMQRPDEMRAEQSMNANLFGSGRGGMMSDAYGGTPEQHAYNMAKNEAMNNASYQSLDQAQKEMMNYGNLGSKMMADQYQPMQNLRQDMELGYKGAGMGQEQRFNQLGMYGDLALGGMGTELNYSNVMGNLFGQAIPGLANAAGGLGGTIDAAGGLFKFLNIV